MPATPPDPQATTTSLCARCGSRIGAGVREGSCASCLAADLAGPEWSDLLSSGGTELLAGGGFTVLEEIGRGGMGVVYRARQRSPQREVALKVLPPAFSVSTDGAQRLLMEAAMLAELDHPGILPLFASGVQDGRPWLAMKLASGGTLAGKQPEWQGRWHACAELAAGLADAVQHAHERGLIHRDLKPGNILFDEARRAYVADFGLAKWRDRESGLTHTHNVLGTPAYMAPEVASADGRAATTASDVYGLGAIFYFLLCGHAPYAKAGTVEVLRRIAESDPAPPRQMVPEVPRDLQVICLKALARKPADRYSGPDALAADLRRWLAGESIEARPAGRSEKVWRWVRQHPLSAGLAAALMVTIAGSTVMQWQKSRVLSDALREARLSLQAAYSSMSYATREIPPQLEAVGRLSALDGLFADIERKLTALDQEVKQPGSADLVYRAELYAHWSRVLRWGGELEASRTKITAAVGLANAAVQADRPEPLAWTVLSMSHRLLAEQFTDEEDFESGLPELEKARAAVRAGRKQFPRDLPLRLEEAEVAHQLCDSRLSEANYVELQKAALEAAALWPALSEEVQKSGVEPSFVQQWRRRSPMPLYFAGVAAEKTGDNETALINFRAFLKEREAQLLASQNAGDRMHEVAAASILLARMLSNTNAQKEEVARHLARANDLTTELVEHVDPQNQTWRAEWASAALSMRLTEDVEKWPRECLRRLEPVKDSPRAYIQELLIEARRKIALMAPTPETSEARWRESLEEAARIAGSQPSRWANFRGFSYLLKDAGDALGKNSVKVRALAEYWIVRASAPGSCPWWNAVEASGHRRLADLNKAADRMEDARVENRSALTLRAGIMSGSSRRACQDMISDVNGACEKLLEIAPPTEADARLVLHHLTKLAPLARESGKSWKWREKWEATGLLAVGILPKAEQAAASAALSAALYPDGAPNRLTKLTTPAAEGRLGK